MKSTSRSYSEIYNILSTTRLLTLFYFYEECYRFLYGNSQYFYVFSKNTPKFLLEFIRILKEYTNIYTLGDRFYLNYICWNFYRLYNTTLRKFDIDGMRLTIYDILSEKQLRKYMSQEVSYRELCQLELLDLFHYRVSVLLERASSLYIESTKNDFVPTIPYSKQDTRRVIHCRTNLIKYSPELCTGCSFTQYCR